MYFEIPIKAYKTKSGIINQINLIIYSYGVSEFKTKI